MELNDIQKSWNAMEERLKENELLTKSLLIKMTQQKGRSSVNRLIFAESIALAFLVLCGPLFFAVNFMEVNKYYTVLSNAMFGLCVFGYVISPLELVYLKKINLQKTIKYNITYVNKYKLLVKIEFVVALLFLIGSVILSFALEDNFKISMIRGVLTLILTLILFTIIWFFYKRNFKSIRESLQELKELDKE